MRERERERKQVVVFNVGREENNETMCKCLCCMCEYISKYIYDEVERKGAIKIGCSVCMVWKG